MTTGWTIEQACPQCGARVEFDEADRILTCGFCRVRHYLMPRDRFRYLLPAAEDVAPEEVFYAPYWRFRGLAGMCRAWDVDCRVVDTSVCGAGSAAFPKTLGFRPQAMKLRFAPPDSSVRYLPLKLSQAKFADYFVTHFMRGQGKVFFRECIGETVSLIYAPFYVQDGRLHDGVLKRPTRLPAEFSVPAAEGKRARWGVSFLPTLCPNCGWDMLAETESCVLLCPKCSRAWMPGGAGYQPVPYAVMPGEGHNICYIPFWRMQASVSGIQLRTQADLVRFANLPRVAAGALADQPVSFWAPAFKIRPQVFLRLARQAMAQQPAGETHDRLEGLDLHPVTLPLREAAESIRVCLALLAARRNETYPALARMKVTLQGCTVVYLPFTATAQEFVNQGLCLAIGRAALRFGRSI